MTHAIPTRRLTTVTLAVLAASLLALAAAGEARADGAPGVRVAPGVFLTDASNVETSGSPSRAARAASDAQRSPRIVGGSETTIGEWPWQAAMTRNPAMFPGNGFARQFCGGSLVAPTLIVSAAHCFFDFNANAFTSPSLYAAITGRTTLSSSEGQEIAVADYKFFTDSGGRPLFNPATFAWDAVLVTLSAPSGATPIKLAGPDEAATWERGRDAYVTGWGTTSESGPRSDVLRAALIAIIGDSTCAGPKVYQGLFQAETQVCAGRLAGGVDSCQGDSGGPLVVPLLGGGFRLVGDTSLGIGCARPFQPGVYGRIAADPLRSALQGAALAAAGVDIVGSGGQPAPQTAPDTTIVNGPSNKTKKKKAKFEFVSSKDGATFTCRIDKKAPVPCQSGDSFKIKKKGRHRISILATIFGITEAAPANDRWKLKRKSKRKGGGGHGGGGGGGGGPAPPRP
jgi:hypothetical protein